jgi:hypothetical protein
VHATVTFGPGLELTATPTVEDTGGEDETSTASPSTIDPTSTPTTEAEEGVTDLPNTGATPGPGGGAGTLIAALVAILLVFGSLIARRRTSRWSDEETVASVTIQ